MTNSSTAQNKKSRRLENPLESYKNLISNDVNRATDKIKKMDGGISPESYWDRYKEGYKPRPSIRQEFSIFNYQNYYEKEIVKKEIKQLTQEVRKELEFIKKADSALIQEAKDIQRVTLEALPEKPGIYHIRFLEIILSILRTLRAKIGESRTWLQAMMSKKKKRGSLFAIRSKKKGTLYSLSQELQSARSIQ